MQPFINYGCKKCYDIGARLNISSSNDDCNSINNRHSSSNNSLRSFIRRCRITRISDQQRSSDRNPLSIPSRCQSYKTFYGRNLRIFVISQSVCPWQAFQVYSNKHSSLVRKPVNHGVGPRCQCYKTFYGRRLRIFVISQSVCPWQVLPAQSIACLARPGAYPRVKHMKGASFMQAPALPSKIRLGQKGLLGTNTLTYYENQ